MISSSICPVFMTLDRKQTWTNVCKKAFLLSWVGITPTKSQNTRSIFKAENQI